MNYGLIGLYGIYFLFVGVRGNASQLLTDVESDAKSFLPWLIAIVVLRALYSSDKLKPVIKPFIGLAALTFVLKNYATMANQMNQLLPSTVQLPP